MKYWESFLEKYKAECETYPLPVILEAFYQYLGCSTQFAVAEVWRTNKSIT